MHKFGGVILSGFYENFVRLCAEKPVSESGAAKAIGLSNAAASHWRAGKLPSRTTQIKLADYFGVTVEDLLSEQKETADPNVGGREKVLSQFADKITELSPENQARLDDFLDYLLDRQRESSQE